MIPASKISAAPILLVFAFLGLSGASSPAHLEPPFPHLTPDEWSFKNKPVATAEELPIEVVREELKAMDEIESKDVCRLLINSRISYYQKSYPRFSLIADDPRAFQLFLHSAVERTLIDADSCFASLLMERIVGSGAHRCNFNVDREFYDPVLRDDIDKVIELVEERHPILVPVVLSAPTLILSNELLVDTKIYLLELDLGPDWIHEVSDLWREELFERDPDRYDFIVEAARRNDFRAVLRTNPPCRQDWDSE